MQIQNSVGMEKHGMFSVTLGSHFLLTYFYRSGWALEEMKILDICISHLTILLVFIVAVLPNLFLSLELSQATYYSKIKLII